VISKDELDYDLMIYNAEKEGKDVEEVKKEISEMKRKKKMEKLDADLDDYFQGTKEKGVEGAEEESDKVEAEVEPVDADKS